MNIHWHASLENVLLYGISAIIVIHAARFASAKLVKMGGHPETFGKAIGALVTFA